MIRPLTAKDLPVAAEVGKLFVTEGQLAGRIVPEVFISKWSALIESGIGFILGLFEEDELVGAIGAIVAEDLNDAKLNAIETFWFVKPGNRKHGLDLLPAYEKEAKARGAIRCSMTYLHSLQPEILHKLYKRRGYQAVETAYFKELN